MEESLDDDVFNPASWDADTRREWDAFVSSSKVRAAEPGLPPGLPARWQARPAGWQLLLQALAAAAASSAARCALRRAHPPQLPARQRPHLPLATPVPCR